MTKLKFSAWMLLLAAFAATSCDKRGGASPVPDRDPIALSYDATNPAYFDNEARRIQLTVSEQSMPILIHSLRPNFDVANLTPDIIDHELDGNVLIIHALAAGEGMISITNSLGEYKLKVDVVVPQTGNGRMYTYAYIVADEMDTQRKTELQKKIIADAPTGRWSMTFSGETAIARRYLTHDLDSEYKEYACTYGEIPIEKFKPFWIPVQIQDMFLMQSSTEEFILYVCNQIQARSNFRFYNFVINVTDRYIGEYPEITAAYEVQSPRQGIGFE